MIARRHLSVAVLRQSGFSLVAAMFLIVVVALMGVYIVTMGGVQQWTATLAIQSARAYLAARAGIEWAAAQAIPAQACPVSASPPSTSFTLTDNGIRGFNVAVQCAMTTAQEHGATVRIYTVTSIAWSGTWGQSDYVQRRMQATLTDAP